MESRQKSKSVFEYSTYRPFLAHMLVGKDRRGQMSRAAESLGCQRSYFSRVIAEELHLTPDHAFKLAQFWRLRDDEREYFQTLVDYERAGDADYRAHLKQRLNAMKKKHESIQERTERAHIAIEGQQAIYFSSWVWSAIHFMTSVPEFQFVEALAAKLGLKASVVQAHLQALEAQGAVAFRNGRWEYAGGEFHAPKESPLAVFHHQNWRQRAVVDAQDPASRGIHFTGVYTASRADFERLREMVLQFISETNRLIGPSEPEDGLVLNLDLFAL